MIALVTVGIILAALLFKRGEMARRASEDTNPEAAA
jgi:hypothetical protein